MRKTSLWITAIFGLVPAMLFGQSRDFRGERLIIDDDNGNLITIQAPSGMAGSWTFQLPAAGPSAAGQTLTSDGSGGYSWAAPSGGGGSIPAGYMILGSSSTPPAGFTASGTMALNGTDAWLAKQPLPAPRFDAGAAESGGKIYVFGGDDGNSTVTATTYEYDPATNTWTTRASMPTTRDAMAVGAVGGKIYVIGGEDAAGSSVLTVNEEYNPATNTWATRAAMPTARRDMGATVAGGKIYVLGGRTNATGSSVYSNLNQEYNPATNTWATRAAMPTGVREPGVASYSGQVYCFGGAGSGNAIASTQIYNPSTNAWSQGAPMPLTDVTLSAEELNGYIYVLQDGYSHFRLDPVSSVWEVVSAPGGSWSPFHNGYHAIGSTIYAVGTNRAVFMYTPKTLLYLFTKS